MKYFSMFSGIGGFEIGIRQTEAKSANSSDSESGTSQLRGRSLCIGYSEIDKYAISIYEKHFKGHRNYGDASKINWAELPDIDLLVGGVPCQAWSIAGQRKGFEDARGTLWFEYFRCLKEKQPAYFLAENVKGLLSHNGGDSMIMICETFCELGYTIDFDVLNSKNFGVPQNRERVFIFGIRNDLLDDCQVF